MESKGKVLVVIDGSNFYHKLTDLSFSKKGLMGFDYGKLIKFLIGNGVLAEARYYVGAVRTEKGNTKSFELFNEQRKLTSRLNKFGIKVVFGYLLKSNGVYHEKGVDVNMAVDILAGAFENEYDKLMLISSDTDLIPAIKKVISRKKKVVYVGFSHKPSFALMRFSTETKLLSQEDLVKCLK